MRSRNAAASGPCTSILPSVETSQTPTAARTIAASRSQEARQSASPGAGKWLGRSQSPASSIGAPRATAPAWVGGRRTGAKPGPAPPAPSAAIGTGV